jgi:restriction system protein
VLLERCNRANLINNFVLEQNLILIKMLSPDSNHSTDITPTEFERLVKTQLFAGSDFKLIELTHNRKINIDGQEYQIDVYYEVEHLGMSFKVLVECKRYKSAIKREKVQVLKDKLAETGCNKGVLVSTSGFQRGTIEYAKRHGIALVRLVNGEMLFQTRSAVPDFVVRESYQYYKREYNLPDYCFQQVEENGEGVSITLLEDIYLDTFHRKLKEH